MAVDLRSIPSQEHGFPVIFLCWQSPSFLSLCADFVHRVADWMIPTLLVDFHKGLAVRLAEVMRRRETIVGLALQASSSSLPQGAAVAPPVQDQARHLSVGEMRAAESSSVVAARLPPAKLPQRALVAQKKAVAWTDTFG